MARKKPKPKPPEPKYTWTMSGKIVTCSKSPTGGQTVVKLWEAEQLTNFHDADLAHATSEINAILSRLQRNNTDRERTLSFVEFQNRQLLVWATYGAVGPHDDDATIVKALRLKSK